MRPARRGRRCRASTATRCAASSSRRATPSRRASSSSACSGTTAPSALRPAQPVPGERRGGPPPLGDGLPAAHATSAATAARRPRSCSSAAAATPTSRASSARSTSRCDDWLAFFMFTMFTDRDGKYQLLRARRERLRPARAHDPLHADRGGAPHVRRRDRRRARRRSARRELMKQDPNEDARAQGGDRPADDPAYLNFWYSLVARPLRRRDLVERGRLLRARASRAARKEEQLRGPHGARPGATRMDGAEGRRGSSSEDVAAAQRDERGAARRLRRRLPARRRPLEQARSRRRASPFRLRAAQPSASTATSASTRACRFDPDGTAAHAARSGSARAASGCRRDADRAYVKSAAEAGPRARQDRELDRAPARGINGLPFDFEYVRLD